MFAAHDRDWIKNIQGAVRPRVFGPIAAEAEIACGKRVNSDEREAEKARVGHPRVDAVRERIYVGVDGIIGVVEVGIASPEFIYNGRIRGPRPSPRAQLNTPLEI